jgi:uncharacterized Fe-S center protein
MEEKIMSTVYFTKETTPENVVKLFNLLNKDLPGKVACKVHSGEKGNQNFLHPEFWKPIIEHVNGVVVECNTAYEGQRNTSEKHLKLIEEHGWSKYFDIDLLDKEEPDLVLPVKNGLVIKDNYLGKNIDNYDSMLVLSHFKGHPSAGYGGALKQLAIGCASSRGKANIHSIGKTTSQHECWKTKPPQDKFLAAMAEAASTVTEYFQGNIAYINIMCNMSVDCDCCAVAEDPKIKGIGILASLDPVAIDQACIDLIYQCDDPGKKHLIERIETRNGIHTIEVAAKLEIGKREYQLIEVD